MSFCQGQRRKSLEIARDPPKSNNNSSLPSLIHLRIALQLEPRLHNIERQVSSMYRSYRLVLTAKSRHALIRALGSNNTDNKNVIRTSRLKGA